MYCLKTGTRLHQIPLDIGTISGFFGKKSLTEIFLSFESFLIPTIIYHADFKGTKPSDPIKLKVSIFVVLIQYVLLILCKLLKLK